MGACFNRNRAISEARGKFVTGLDDDDFFLPMRLENFINYWEHKNPDAIALFSNKIVKYGPGVHFRIAPLFYAW